MKHTNGSKDQSHPFAKCSTSHTGKPAAQLDEFLGRQVRVDVRAFGQEPNAPTRRRFRGAYPEQFGFTTRGSDQPSQHLDGSGLPRAVWPEKAKNVTSRHFEANGAHRFDSTHPKALLE